MEASNEGEVLHVPKERVRYVLQTQSFESYKDGRSHRQDAERWLGNPHTNVSYWGSPNPASLRETRHDHGFLQKSVSSIGRAFAGFRECRSGGERHPLPIYRSRRVR